MQFQKSRTKTKTARKVSACKSMKISYAKIGKISREEAVTTGLVPGSGDGHNDGKGGGNVCGSAHGWARGGYGHGGGMGSGCGHLISGYTAHGYPVGYGNGNEHSSVPISRFYI